MGSLFKKFLICGLFQNIAFKKYIFKELLINCTNMDLTMDKFFFEKSS